MAKKSGGRSCPRSFNCLSSMNYQINVKAPVLLKRWFKFVLGLNFSSNQFDVSFFVINC